MNKDKVIQTLQESQPELAQFQVSSLWIFGSMVRDEAGPDSDVDILVEFEPGAHVGLFALARLQRCLQKILGRKVDLATEPGNCGYRISWNQFRPLKATWPA